MSVLEELREKRSKVQGKLDKYVADVRVTDEESGEERDRDLTAEEAADVTDLLEKRAKLDERIAEEETRAKAQAALAEARRAVTPTESRSDDGVDVSVVKEQMIYGVGAPNSFYADMYYIDRYPWNSPMHQAARARQAEWSHQVEREISNGSQFGKKAEKQFREFYRSPQGSLSNPGSGPDWQKIYAECRSRGRVGLADKSAELRSITTDGGATASAPGGAAAFVTPIFTESDYVPYRQFGRTFADCVTKRPLPAYGMSVYMPQITGPAAVASAYSEGGSVTETDPTQGYISAGLTIIAGQVTSSQAVLDRTGPNFEYDVVIWDQLERNYAQVWDTYVITQAVANAHTQSWSGNSSAFVLVDPSGNGSGGFVGQIAKAAAYMETLQGTVLSPTHLFLQPARWRYITAWGDGNERPVVVPQQAGPFNAWSSANGDPKLMPEGYTGFTLGGLPVYTDANLPLQGTTTLDTAIVADASQTWSYEGAPVHRVLPQTLGGNLEVIFQQYSYGAVLQRYNSAVVEITGSGMSAITYTD